MSLLVREKVQGVEYGLKIFRFFNAQILACGAQLKNTFCLTKGDFAILSPSIGDLSNLEALTTFEDGIERLQKLIACEPEVIAYDLHPEYLSTKYALSLDPTVKVGVQHHHSHIASCMAENGLAGPVIGVAFDGTGFGEDRNIWGGEFLVADFKGYRRWAHLEYIPMPGGSQAIREPWRMAASYLHHIYGNNFLDLDLTFIRRLNKNKWSILEQMILKKINSPLTSSIGRLFDAVASLVGVRDMVEYEGQAAIELERAATASSRSPAASYRFEIKEEDEHFVVDPGLVIAGVVEDLQKGVSIQTISAKFHNAIAGMIVKVCSEIRKRTGVGNVVLSGGVFQNRLLIQKVPSYLQAEKFNIFTHHQVPTNDNGISLGQAVVADATTRGRLY